MHVGLGRLLYGESGNEITIFNTTFVNNIAVQYCNSNCCFTGGLVYAHNSSMIISCSILTNNTGTFLEAENTNVTINHSEFVSNNFTIYTSDGMITSIDYCKFINNSNTELILNLNTSVSISHSEFANSSYYYPVESSQVLTPISLSITKDSS